MTRLSYGRRAAVLAALVFACSACSSVRFLPFKSGREPVPTPAAAADDGRQAAPETPLALSDENDFVVRVVVGSTTCSGTLIEEDRVLTAHHCVADREVGAADVSPDRVRVELGGDYLPWGEVGVRAIIAPPCGYKQGEGDLAILVLERRLIGVATLPPRLDREPVKGEPIEPLGFGRCAGSEDGIRRKERSGGAIEALGSGRFRMVAAICPGDSGGPALSPETHELVGVISASVMDGNESTAGVSDFTRLDRWRPVFALAEQVAQGAEIAELPPLDCSSPTP